jgi:hypothetical protein
MMFADVSVRSFIDRDSEPTAAEIKRCGSLLQQRLMTQKVMAPGSSFFNPSVLEIILQPGGKYWKPGQDCIFSIPASRKASSKECSCSLWVPTPLVKKVF